MNLNDAIIRDVRIDRRVIEGGPDEHGFRTFVPGRKTFTVTFLTDRPEHIKSLLDAFFKGEPAWFDGPCGSHWATVVESKTILSPAYHMEFTIKGPCLPPSWAKLDKRLDEITNTYATAAQAKAYLADWLPPLHPNCRCAGPETVYPTRKEGTMSPKNAKTPRFYVASVSISKTLVPDLKPSDFEAARRFHQGAPDNDYVKYTEAEAVAEAKKLVEQDGMDRFVVKIVRRVRRKPQPIVVEDVK